MLAYLIVPALFAGAEAFAFMLGLTAVVAVIIATVNGLAKLTESVSPTVRARRSLHERQAPVAAKLASIQESLKRARETHRNEWTEATKKLRQARMHLEELIDPATTSGTKARASLGERQKADFLQGSLISSARIKGIGPVLQSELRSFGFETAADILRKSSHQSRLATSNTPPRCPTCGSSMTKRRARRGAYAGRLFWGCTRYPNCRGIVNISPVVPTSWSSTQGLQSVPGIGPTRAADLIRWARKVEQSFRPRLDQKLVQQEISRLRAEARAQAQRHLDQLRRGPRRLKAINQSLEAAVRPFLADYSTEVGNWQRLLSS